MLSFLSRLTTSAPYFFAQTEGFRHLSEWILEFRNMHARTIFVEVPEVKAEGERVLNVLAQEKVCQNVLFSVVFYFRNPSKCLGQADFGILCILPVQRCILVNR